MAHAAERTMIMCHKMDCRWNDQGQCAAAQILVDDGPVCLTYEPRFAAVGMPPGMVPGGPIAASPAAPAGANPLAALLGATRPGGM
ncbi:MAG TPA: hypothetical protein VF234_07245 [Limnochordia bacterium]